MDHRDIVVIAASRGGISVLKTLVAQLAPDLPVAVCIVLHIGGTGVFCRNYCRGGAR
jgi:two-component system chemotaxis response regulator CheB